MKNTIYEDSKRAYYESNGSLFYLSKKNNKEYKILEEEDNNIYLFSLSGLVLQKNDTALYAAKNILEESKYKDMSIDEIKTVCSINYDGKFHRSAVCLLDNILKLKCINQINTREYIVISDESFLIDIESFNITGLNASCEYIEALNKKPLSYLVNKIATAKIVYEINERSL